MYSSKNSRFLYEGINVAIVGKPNVGKSSLLNAIINEEKAIVTNVPGTTRDVVEHRIQVGDLLLNLKDTAGIHLTENKIEKIGIKKSFDQIENADLVIHVLDAQSK
jgi:tRNA modification GTPase